MRRPRSGRDRLGIERVPIDAAGYDADGGYWGAGPDAFILTSPNGAHEVTVRATSVAAARAKAREILTGMAKERTVEEPPIGGRSPHVTRFRIAWPDPVSGTRIAIRITHARGYLAAGSDHVEIESVPAKGSGRGAARPALPITETGYRSHFIAALDLVNAGGPVSLVTGWLDREARGKAWRDRIATTRQGDLFQWAAARAETAGGRRTARREGGAGSAPRPAAGKPRRRPEPRSGPG